MKDVKYEVEMLRVGNADAYIIYHCNGSDKSLILIDAGELESHGKKIVEHLKEHYPGKDIDLAINTHPDLDHIGGFLTVLDEIKIKEFWMFNPWSHFQSSRITEMLSDNVLLVESLNDSSALIQKVNEKSRLVEPYPGCTYKEIITVIGPELKFYKKLLPKFRNSRDHFLFEAIDNKPFGVDRSAENNSSIVLVFTPDGKKKYLFTGDAGPSAFQDIWSNHPELMPKHLDWLDVPHHGSSGNFDKRLLDLKPKVAFISAAGIDDHHPSIEVVKALRANGSKVYCSNKSNILHRVGTEPREGYKTASEYTPEK